MKLMKTLLMMVLPVAMPIDDENTRSLLDSLLATDVNVRLPRDSHSEYICIACIIVRPSLGFVNAHCQVLFRNEV